MVGGSALAAAIIAEVRYKSLNSLEEGLIEQVSRIYNQDDLFLKLEAMSGLVFGTTGVSLLFGIVCLVGRIFYPEKNQHIIIALVMHDSVCSALFGRK